MEEEDKIWSKWTFSVHHFLGLHTQIHMEYMYFNTEFKSQHGVKCFIGHKPVFFRVARRWIKTLSPFFVKLMRTTYIQEHYQTFFSFFSAYVCILNWNDAMSPWLGTQIKAQILTINQIHVTDQNVEPWICILIKQSYIILVLGGGINSSAGDHHTLSHSTVL